MSARPLSTFAPAPPVPATPRQDAGMSTVNLAARQRMLSQRLLLQTVLAAQGSASQLAAARASLALFADSQARLEGTHRQLDATSAAAVRELYGGTGGVGPAVAAFVRQAGEALDAIAANSARMADAVAALAERGDATLDALNRATSSFDRIASAQAESTTRELGDIVGSIQRVAREAKVVAFNAQVMAARAGQHGREFAVVAQVLSGITQQVDGLSLRAATLIGARA